MHAITCSRIGVIRSRERHQQKGNMSERTSTESAEVPALDDRISHPCCAWTCTATDPGVCDTCVYRIWRHSGEETRHRLVVMEVDNPASDRFSDRPEKNENQYSAKSAFGGHSMTWHKQNMKATSTPGSAFAPALPYGSAPCVDRFI